MEHHLDVRVDQNGDGSTDQQTTLTDNASTAVTDSITSDVLPADQSGFNKSIRSCVIIDCGIVYGRL
jgi:hypothetical protein